MPYDPVIHHRHSIRLKGYDYSRAGMYFVTICVQKHTCLFGKIIDGKMILNDAGKMVEKWCTELSHKFSDIVLDAYVVMPNHFHVIIVNTGNDNTNAVTETVPVGADLRVCPNKNDAPNENILGTPNENILGTPNGNILGEHGGNILGEHGGNILGEHGGNILGEHGGNILGEHVGSPLHAVVQWFKTMTTNEYIRGVKTLGWRRFDKKLWQRDYWEHIIRNGQSYQRIAKYIINNPINWQNDRFHTK